MLSDIRCNWWSVDIWTHFVQEERHWFLIKIPRATTYRVLNTMSNTSYRVSVLNLPICYKALSPLCSKWNCDPRWLVTILRASPKQWASVTHCLPHVSLDSRLGISMPCHFASELIWLLRKYSLIGFWLDNYKFRENKTISSTSN